MYHKNIIPFLLVVTLFCVCSGCFYGITHNPESNDFYFVLMSDPQLYGSYNQNNFDKNRVRQAGGFLSDDVIADPGNTYFRTQDIGLEQEDVLFARAIGHANRLNPAFVVIAGDLVQNHCKDKKEVDAFKRITGELDEKIPLYLVAGNHDLSHRSMDTLPLYRKTFGPDRYSFEYKDRLFIVLNSELMRLKDAQEGQSGIQLQWARKELAKTRSKQYLQVIVFMHHPIVMSDPKNKHIGASAQNRKAYLDLFDEYAVTAVFSGHAHFNDYARHKSIEFITTSSTCMPLGQDAPGFRVVKLYDNRIEHDYYSYESMPNRVKME
jgi:predicted phosphodiesterase